MSGQQYFGQYWWRLGGGTPTITSQYPGFTEISFTTDPVDANSTADMAISLGLNRCMILRLIIEPSIANSRNRFELYNSGSYDADLLAYGTLDFEGNLIDPMEDQGLGPVERADGLIGVYVDQDGNQELHLRIVNSHVEAQTYQVWMVYRPITKLIAGDGIAVAGNPDNADHLITPSLIADSTRQPIEVRVDGSLIGTVPAINLLSGDRMVLSSTLVGDEAQITATPDVQGEAFQSLFWAIH